MKILIAEDDFASRKFLFKILSPYGECDITVDGIETVEAFVMAHDEGEPYDLLCLDIMMPKIDGLKVLQTIRDFEKKKGISGVEKCKVIIASAIDETEVDFDSFSKESEVYVTKPFDVEKMKEALRKLEIIQ